MPEYTLVFLLFLGLTALLYASIGHGGASGYLAIMALFSVEVIYMKPSALVLNLGVSSIAFFSYCRAGYFRKHLLLPFVITSIPAAYLGAQAHIPASLYKALLGICLIIATLRLILHPQARVQASRLKPPLYVALFIGAFLGYISGMIGIGGGIILSPLLLLAGWASIKESAAASAGFIWLNSLSGIIGLGATSIHLAPTFISWVIVALIAGSIGAWVGSSHLHNKALQKILAVVLLMASVKLLGIFDILSKA